LTVMVAVLCHDLGKGYTDTDELPGHPGHERRGLESLVTFARRFPSLLDQRGLALARDVCELHVEIRRPRELPPRPRPRLHAPHFRARDCPVALFALAVAADSGGRLGLGESGPRMRQQVRADLEWLRRCCEQVDAEELRARHPEVAAFKAALHEARAR